MKKRLFALALSLIMLLGTLSTLPVVAAEATEYTGVVTMTSLYEGDKTVAADTVYSISSVDELFYFAELCNEANGYFAGATVILEPEGDADEIVMNEGWTASATAPTGTNAKTWTPIARFSGVFDGQGNTLSGFYAPTGVDYKFADGANEISCGFFASMAGNATIRNLNIINSYFASTAVAGGVVGVATGEVANSITIENATSSAKVVSTSQYAGGILGVDSSNDTNGVTVNGCTFSGEATSTKYVGGILGYSWRESEVLNCVNTGTLYATGSGAVIGGIVGTHNYAKHPLVVTSCVNMGTITATASGAHSLGGIVGEMQSANGAELKVTNCVNFSNISSASGSGYPAYGGILGKSNVTSIPLLTNCAAYCDIGGTTVDSGSGGLVGWYDGTTARFVNCIFSGTTSTSSSNKRFIGDFIGIANAKNTAGYIAEGVENVLYFENCYHDSTFNNSVGTSVSGTNGRYFKVNGTEVKSCADLAAWNKPFADAGCNAFTAAQLTDLNAIKNLSVLDWADSENGWTIEQVDGKGDYLPMPVSVARLVAADKTEVEDGGVEYHGVQLGVDGTSVRFISTVDDLNRDKIGFEVIVIKDGKYATDELSDGTVYTSLTYTDENGNGEISPNEGESNPYTVDGKFLGALVYNDLPSKTGEAVTFVITAFSETNGDRTYDDTYIVALKKLETGCAVYSYQK